jgi:hypothetical protein
VTTTIPLTECDIVCVYDPARSRESEYRALARHAVMTCAMSQTYDVFVLAAWAKRVPLPEVLHEIQWQCDTFSPRVIGVESIGMQYAIADVVDAWLRLNHELAPIDDLMPDTRVNKKWRIRMQIQRVAPFGKLWFQDHHLNLYQEYSAFPNGRTIDLMDVLAYCIALLNPNDPDATDFHADYLRRRRESEGIDTEDEPLTAQPEFSLARYRKVPTSAREYFRQQGIEVEDDSTPVVRRLA